MPFKRHHFFCAVRFETRPESSVNPFVAFMHNQFSSVLLFVAIILSLTETHTHIGKKERQLHRPVEILPVSSFLYLIHFSLRRSNHRTGADLRVITFSLRRTAEPFFLDVCGGGASALLVSAIAAEPLKLCEFLRVLGKKRRRWQVQASCQLVHLFLHGAGAARGQPSGPGLESVSGASFPLTVGCKRTYTGCGKYKRCPTVQQ